MASGDPFAKLLDTVHDAVERQSWCAGCQIVVQIEDEVVVDEALGVDGLGIPLKRDDMVAIYCAGKPLTSVAIGAMVDAGELSWNDVLADVVEGYVSAELGTITVDELVSHTAGLGGYPAVSFLSMPPAHRSQQIRMLGFDPATRNQFGYSEFVSWGLLQMAIEDVLGRPFVNCLRDLILEPWDLPIAFRVAADSEEYHRLRVNVDTTNSGAPTPLLWEVSATNLQDVRAPTGAYSSMRSLNRFYRLLLDTLEGRVLSVISRDQLRTMVRPKQPPNEDPLLGRRCSFGRGFMTDLRQHGFSESHSRRSFGHTGVSGMTTAGADPELQLSYAIHLNTITNDDPTSGDLRLRPDLRRHVIVTQLTDATRSLQGHFGGDAQPSHS